MTTPLPPDLDWEAVDRIDRWLDRDVAPAYLDHPLAQDWARVAKITEEAGEAVDALIGCTGQNPRKGAYGSVDDLLGELADAALTGIFAIQHFTKDTAATRQVVASRLARILSRVPRESPGIHASASAFVNAHADPRERP